MTLGIPLKNKHSKHIAGPAEFIGLTETRTEKKTALIHGVHIRYEHVCIMEM